MSDYLPECMQDCRPEEWSIEHAAAASREQDWATKAAHTLAATQLAQCAEAIAYLANQLDKAQQHERSVNHDYRAAEQTDFAIHA
jgi:hypothetical protein